MPDAPTPTPVGMLVGSPPGAPASPIGRLPAISVTFPFCGIDLDNPFGADLGHDQFAVGRQRDAFRHFQVLGDHGFLAVGFDLRDLPGKGLRDVDIALRAADQSDRPFEAADQHRAVLAVLAAGADQRFAAEFVDENAAVVEPDRVVRGLEAVHHLLGRAGLAVDHLHRAGEPARQDHVVALGGGAHRIFQRHAGGMHARRFGDFAGRAIDGAIGEHVGDVDGVLAAVGDDADAAGQRQLADDDLFGGAGLGVDLLDSVIGHVGDEDAVLVVDREVVERGFQLRDHFLGAGLGIDLDQLTERGIHHPEIALGVEIDRGGNLEAVGDHRQLGLVDVDFCDLALEPQRTVQHVVGSEFEAVEAAHLLHDHARRLDAFDVDFIERVAEEHGGGVEPSVLAVGQRVDAGQAGGELLDRAVALAGVEVAGEKSGPRHGAVGRKRDVVGHAFGRRYRDLRGAVVAIDLVERRSRDAAGEQAPGLVDPEPMHAVKRRAGDQFGDFICLRRCADAGGEKDCRRDSRTQCKPASS